MIYLVDWITIGIGLPLTLIVIVAVFLQNQDCPIFVINLLFSDLIQFCGKITMNRGYFIGSVIFNFGLFASLGFMVCISLERYLVIAKPLWYRFTRNIKTSVVVCVLVWGHAVLFSLMAFLLFDSKMFYIILSCVFLLPFPFFIFCLVETIKALSVPADEKRRIAAIQVAVLLIYTLLFLPTIVVVLLENTSFEVYTYIYAICYVCLSLSPIADTTLYLLSRKSFLDKFLASLCSCETSDSQEMNTRDIETTTGRG
uniref:G-protein coupled receptor 4-like n=1 Tax=Fundulus heteroclitus TaxID=8078 RepID=A0A3Q2PH52_FUNHE